MPCLHRQDVLFSDSRESKTPNPPPNKRLATEATLQVAEAVKCPKRPRAIDNRPPCVFWHKPATWLKTVGANSRIRGGRITIEAVALMRPLCLSTTSPRLLSKP